MKKRWGVWLAAACMLAMMFFGSSLKAEAGNVTNGTLGDNAGIEWTYDADTKTLTITGEDRLSGQNQSPFIEDCSDAKKVVVENCTLSGDARYLFAGLAQVESFVFEDFDTSNVHTASFMFDGCFNVVELDVSGFDTSNVTDMCGMFRNCSSLTELDVSGFDTSRVTDMYSMFTACSKVTKLDVSGFDTSSMENMAYMFSDCTALTELDVSGFDTSNVKYMPGMFSDCSNLTYLDLSNFDFAKVEIADRMLNLCTNLNTIKTPKTLAEGMSIALPKIYADTNGNMYHNIDGDACDKTLTAIESGYLGDNNGITWGYDSKTKTLFITGEDTGTLGVAIEGSVFVDICPDVEKVLVEDCKLYDCAFMFNELRKLKSVSFRNFDTSEVTNMQHMFSQCMALEEVDVSGFDTSNVTSMAAMFESCSALQELDLSNFDTAKVTDMRFMFTLCEELDELDVSGFDTSNVTQMDYMFVNCSGLTELDLKNFDTAKVTSMTYMLAGCSKLETLDMSGMQLASDCNTEGVLMYDNALATIKTPNTMADGQSIELPHPLFDSDRNVIFDINTNSCGMTLTKELDGVQTGVLGPNEGILWFYDETTKTLTVTGEDESLPVSYETGSAFVDICPDVEKIIMRDCKLCDCSCLFMNLTKVESIIFDNFDTSQVRIMGSMFEGCSSLTSVDMSSLNTANVTLMPCMFQNCSNLTSVNLSGVNTAKVNNMSSMFRGCDKLADIDVSGFNTSQVIYIMGMFADCAGLTELDVSNFNTSKVQYMDDMFNGCTKLKTLDISGFTFDSVETADRMLRFCIVLDTIKTPKAMKDGVSVALPAIFVNGEGKETVSLSGANCEQTLTLKAGNISRGTMGNNQNIYWYFDYSTGTFMLTGEDTFYTGNASGSALKVIFPDAEHVVFENFKACDGNYLLAGMNKVESITFDNFDISNVTGMTGMFYGCSALKSVDLSDFDVSKIGSMDDMFTGCSALETIKAPAVMGNAFSTDLPGTFLDSEGNRVTKLTKAYAGQVLNKEINVSGITLNVDRVSVEQGKAYQLQATITPDNAANKAVTWKPSNTAVATVDETGKVTAVAPGTAIITVIAKDGSGVSASCEVTVVEPMTEQERQVRAFVERMYTIVLNRPAEEQGLADWTARLMAQELDGGTLVNMFVFSDEFIARNVNNEEYIQILYRAVLGREADADGLQMWKELLDGEWTRDQLKDGFVLSDEFKVLCGDYGIIPVFPTPDVPDDPDVPDNPDNPDDPDEPDAAELVRDFVRRMYTVVLNRPAEEKGLNDWTNHLLNGIVNGAQVADGFIGSEEFANRNLSNEDYVKVLYRAFFNREADEGGFNVWMNELAKGASRRDVMKGFVHSVEFSDLCAQYGIIRGEIQ